MFFQGKWIHGANQPKYRLYYMLFSTTVSSGFREIIHHSSCQTVLICAPSICRSSKLLNFHSVPTQLTQSLPDYHVFVILLIVGDQQFWFAGLKYKTPGFYVSNVIGFYWILAILLFFMTSNSGLQTWNIRHQDLMWGFLRASSHRLWLPFNLICLKLSWTACLGRYLKPLAVMSWVRIIKMMNCNKRAQLPELLRFFLMQKHNTFPGAGSCCFTGEL